MSQFRGIGFMFALGLGLALAGMAQAPAARARRGAMRPAMVDSPQVNPDDTVTMRLRAPDATNVVVVGELDGKEHPMTKGADGVWTVTIGPLKPDVYNYQFRVDGVMAADPMTPAVKIGFGAFPSAAEFEVPASNGLAFDDAQPVPHGTVRIETYESKAIGAPRVLWIYTPPGYESSHQRYPVFYLLHGSGGIAQSWVTTGRENYIMDNLIAAGKAKPMIIVNPLGYAREGVGIAPERAADKYAFGLPRPGAAARRGFTANTGDSPFAQDLLGDVMPYVEAHYRTLNDANDRALGGLSMGGGQTIAIGFTHTNLFHTIVVMSAGARNADTAYPAFFKDPAATNKTLKLLWVGVGGADPIAGASATAFDAVLTQKGIHHDFWVLPGARHEWVVWRHALDTVAPLMFR